MLYYSRAFGRVFSPFLDMWIIGFVKNKGIIRLKAIFFVVYFLLSYFMSCFCFPCWLNNFSSFVGSRKDKHRIPWVTQYWNSHRLAWTHVPTHTHPRTYTHAYAQSLANDTGLSSFIRPMHRCRACSVLMKNNLSKSVVALRQPFSPNVTFKRGSLLTHYCSKATEPKNCLGQLNEVPIMNAMIKCPLVQ